MLHIEVRVFAYLRQQICSEVTSDPNEVFRIAVPQGTTLEKLLIILNLPTDQPIITLVNGLRQPFNYLLLNEDRVGLFPPVGGGGLND